MTPSALHTPKRKVSLGAGNPNGDDSGIPAKALLTQECCAQQALTCLFTANNDRVLNTQY